MTPPSSLEALRDIRLPPQPDLWPPAPGWWLSAIALMLPTAVVVARRYARRAPLRRALRELDALVAEHRREADPVRLARGLSKLLRRYALRRFPEAHIAGLSGTAWLEFLHQHGGGNDFKHGPGALLATLPYRPALARSRDAAAAPDEASMASAANDLISLVRRWLRTNAP